MANITNMSDVFRLCSKVSGEISGFDMRKVGDMSSLLCRTRSFHGTLNDWVLAGVTATARMLGSCAFDGEIGSWNVSASASETSATY